MIGQAMFKALLAKFFPGPTPAKDNLRDELRARQIRNEAPLDYYARTIEATPDQLHEAKIHYRDQLDAGADPQVAMYRAKVHTGSIKSRDARLSRMARAIWPHRIGAGDKSAGVV